MIADVYTDYLFEYRYWLNERYTSLARLYKSVKSNQGKGARTTISRLRSIPPVYDFISLNRIKAEFKKFLTFLIQQQNFHDCLYAFEKEQFELDEAIIELYTVIKEDTTLKILKDATTKVLIEQSELLLAELNEINNIKVFEIMKALDKIRLSNILSPLLQPQAEIEEKPKAATVKIPWNGTAPEFGAIKGREIEQGYIPKIKDLKNTVSLLHSHYKILDTEGKEITFEYLYRCFSERAKQYYPGEFVLPKSDNYGKNQ